MKAWNRFLCAVVMLSLGLLREPASAQQAPQTLRVLTYNIHHGEGTDGKLDLERLARVIKEANPDLVALQEVDQRTRRTGGVDQAAKLSELTGMQVAFGKAMDYQGGAYGLAILSRWPLKEPRTHALPADAGIEPRAVLEARVQPGGDAPEITFLVTHLDATRDPLQRMNQAAKIRELFPVSEEERAMILAGDMNATPESEVLQGLRSEWTDSAAGAKFLTSPAGAPRNKIDYILYRPASRWRVLETRALEEAVASDHRAVLAVFELLR
ncbi:MAG: endonuclease [Verrucomicrobiaceae bacterium]|nr:MAG: endonuclease [Verrucomicrobiaceae bacterium]